MCGAIKSKCQGLCRMETRGAKSGAASTHDTCQACRRELGLGQVHQRRHGAECPCMLQLGAKNDDQLQCECAVDSRGKGAYGWRIQAAVGVVSTTVQAQSAPLMRSGQARPAPRRAAWRLGRRVDLDSGGRYCPHAAWQIPSSCPPVDGGRNAAKVPICHQPRRSPSGASLAVPRPTAPPRRQPPLPTRPRSPIQHSNCPAVFGPP